MEEHHILTLKVFVLNLPHKSNHENVEFSMILKSPKEYYFHETYTPLCVR